MAAQAESLHVAAADVLRRSCRGEGTRQVLYAVNVPPAVKSQLQAIVLGAQNNESLLLTVAEDCGFMYNVHPDLVDPDNKHLLVVLYEALLGSRRVRGTSQVVELVKKHKALLQQQLASHRKVGKAVAHQEKIKLPRYVRVNTLKVSMEQAVKHFELRGWKLREGKAGGIEANLLNPPKGVMVKDPLVPNLLVFPAGISLHNDSLVDSGSVILQDRSSCLSAAALAPIPADAVIADACAAPGNKTSHVASLLAMARLGLGDSDGRVLAFERDPKRERMLRKQMQTFGFGQMVNVRGREFAQAIEEALAGEQNSEADMLRQVTHVLVDPSCSGSGLVAQYHGSATGVQTGEDEDAETVAASHSSEYQSVGGDIASLATEQEKLVLAAMSLPQARVVVYSTCSVHRQENEDVVEKILARAPAGFKLVKALPSWPHRGLAAAPASIGPYVVRATHLQDSTNGFFVARFQRLLPRPTPLPPHHTSAALAQRTGKRLSGDLSLTNTQPALKKKPRMLATRKEDESEQLSTDEDEDEDEDEGDQLLPEQAPTKGIKDKKAVQTKSVAHTDRQGAGEASQLHASQLQASNSAPQPSQLQTSHLSNPRRKTQNKTHGSSAHNSATEYKEYRPCGAATRPWAIYNASVKAQRQGDALAPSAKAKAAVKPAAYKWANALDVD